MEYLKLLSLGAIALAVSACIVVYVLHRQTTARLDALTQANMGITHTLHRLIASSMPHPGGGGTAASGGAAGSGGVGGGVGSGVGSGAVVPAGQQTHATEIDNDSDDEPEADDVKALTNRIVVSDDDISSTDEDDYSDDGTDDGESESESEGEDDRDVETATQDNVANSHSHKGRFEELSDGCSTDDGISDEASDDYDSDGESESEGDDEDEDEDEDEDGNAEGNSNEDKTENKGTTALDVVRVNSSEVPAADNEEHDEIDLVAFILPKTSEGDNDIDIGIIPVNSKQKKSIQDVTEKHKHAIATDGLRQLKVEELRKMAVAILGMTEEDAKKVKKPQLVQKLGDAAVKAADELGDGDTADDNVHEESE